METGKSLKRKVSIGFVRPESLEGNTIYVQLRQKEGQFSAEATSQIPFNYSEPFGNSRIYMRERKADSTRTGKDGIGFIEMLVQQNKGEREFRYFEDAYRMLGQL
jgi:hypothetical protein